MVQVKCVCGKLNQADDHMAGQRAPCGGCWRTIVFPAAAPAPAALERPALRPELLQEPKLVPIVERVPRREAALARPRPADDTARFFCRCGKRLHAPLEMIGEEIQCPSCRRFVKVPDPKAPPPEAEPEPPPPPPTFRDHLYWVLLIGLIPLFASIFTTVRGGPTPLERFRKALEAHPEVVKQFGHYSPDALIEDPDVDFHEVIRALPGRKVDNLAYLPVDSDRHWLYAAITVLVFWGLSRVLFAAGSAKTWQLILVGMFTGTLGIGYLFLVQAIPLFAILYAGTADSPDINLLTKILAFVFGVGLCEEVCKAAPLVWRVRRRPDLGWRGACLWGMASGVGFGVSEALNYAELVYHGIASAEIYLLRFSSLVTLHAVWSASVAIVLWRYHRREGEWNRFFARLPDTYSRPDAGGWHPWPEVFVLFRASTWISEATGGWSQLAFLVVPLVRVVAIAAVLHGLYDVFVGYDEPEMYIIALFIGLLSFAWLAWQIETCREQERKRAAAESAPATA